MATIRDVYFLAAALYSGLLMSTGLGGWEGFLAAADDRRDDAVLLLWCPIDRALRGTAGIASAFPSATMPVFPNLDFEADDACLADAFGPRRRHLLHLPSRGASQDIV